MQLDQGFGAIEASGKVVSTDSQLYRALRRHLNIVLVNLILIISRPSLNVVATRLKFDALAIVTTNYARLRCLFHSNSHLQIIEA